MSKEEIYIFVPPLKKEEILILPEALSYHWYSRECIVSFYQLMEVFQNGPIGQLAVFRVGVDSNYAIETVPVPLQHMEEKVVRAGILQMYEHV